MEFHPFHFWPHEISIIQNQVVSTQPDFAIGPLAWATPTLLCRSMDARTTLPLPDTCDTAPRAEFLR
ncbi:TPA: hypothetical protein ACOEA0_004287, partial [Stenotrophomonas maltophilia]